MALKRSDTNGGSESKGVPASSMLRRLSPKPAMLPDDNLSEAREITDGAAMGWVIRAVVNGNKGFKYTWRPPGSTRWLLRGQAQKMATKEVWQVVEVTREDIAKRIRNACLAEKKIQQEEAFSESAPGEEPEEEETDVEDRQAQANDSKHEHDTHEFDDGLAKGWTVRARVNPGKGIKYFWRPPGCTLWLPRAQAEKTATVEIWQLVEAARHEMTERMKAKDSSVSKKTSLAGGRLKAQRAGQPEMMQRTVVGGAAHGWTIRIVKPEYGKRRFKFRKPHTQEWQSAASVAAEIDIPIARALDTEKARLAEDIRMRRPVREYKRSAASIAGHDRQDKTASVTERRTRRARIAVPDDPPADVNGEETKTPPRPCDFPSDVLADILDDES